MDPLVSVITPTYNRASTLPRLWESLRVQSLQQFEWIVVDDGSTDHSGELIRCWMRSDQRIRYIAHQVNLGVNRARESGGRYAVAPYLLFIDSDDELYDEDTLRVMYEAISQAPETVGAVFFATVYEDGTPACFMSADKMTLGYEDLICNQRAKGEFATICRKSYIDCSPWSPYRGLESWHIYARSRYYDTIFVNRFARIYHRDEAERLTSAQSVIERAEEMYVGILSLLAQHGEVFKARCPIRLAEYHFHLALYAALANRWQGVLHALKALRVRKYTLRSTLLLAAYLLPLRLRHKLFCWWVSRKEKPKW